MSVAVSPQIYELLKNAVDNNIGNYSVFFHGSNKKGEGYLGDMHYVSLRDNRNGKELNFVVKQAFDDEKLRSDHGIRDCYLNEICFYEKIWPALHKFQRSVASKKPFDKIPKCFTTTSEDKEEKLVFENLRYKNFVTFNKKGAFDKEHVEFIFKQYGRFHGISFAYKQLNPEEYAETTKGMKDLWLRLYGVKGFNDFIKSLHELCLKNLDPEEDAGAIEKYKRYIENGGRIFYDSNIYKGKYSAVLHGDCWSNNIMFKYDDSKKLIDIRLLDFQFTKIGTPVSDLAYCLYSGGSKEVCDELDYYLKVYHNSLLETVEELGGSPEGIYPFEELKKDWKQYCKMGFTMGLMLWRSKLTDEEDIKDLKDITEEEENIFLTLKCDEEAFKKRTRDLILHLYENDFL